MTWRQWTSQAKAKAGQVIRTQVLLHSSQLAEVLYKTWHDAEKRAQSPYQRWQAVWKAWWHWVLDFKPVVKRMRLGVRGVPVRVLAAFTAASHGLKFVQTVSSVAVPVRLTTRVGNALTPHSIQAVVHDAVAIILGSVRAKTAIMLGDLPLACRTEALTRYSAKTRVQALLPQYGVKAQPLSWPSVMSPSSFRLRRLTVASPAVKTIKQTRIRGVCQSDDKKVWRQPLVRQPVAAHRFSLQERNVFREALAKKAGVTDASKILLTTVVDRIPGTQVAHMQSTEDGSVSYRLVPERKSVGHNQPAQTGVVVVGRHLQTRQTIRAFVPASEYLNVDDASH